MGFDGLISNWTVPILSTGTESLPQTTAEPNMAIFGGLNNNKILVNSQMPTIAANNIESLAK
jgi:hypothetical protein